MAKEWKASELDSRCSEACVRAGLTALLFSALAISLLQPLTRQKAFDAFENYVALRLTLKYILDELDRTECWQEINHSEPGVLAPNKWTIAKLAEHKCIYKQREPETNLEPTAPSDLAPGGKLRRIPRVPWESTRLVWEPITPNRVHYVILTSRPLKDSTVVGWPEKIVDQPTCRGVRHDRGRRDLL